MKNARDKNAGTDENRLGLRVPAQTKNVQSSENSGTNEERAELREFR